MKRTETYRRQHKEVRGIIAEINQLLDLDKISENADPISKSVRLLFGKFGTHLAIEDKVLYPGAVNHSDPALSKLARDFQKEMGNLSLQFDDYRHNWPGPLAISRSPDAFVEQTKDILSLLNKRLEREENELYTLYDQVA